MRVKWFDAQAVSEIGTELADQFVSRRATSPSRRVGIESQGSSNVALAEILERADREVRTLKLNLYKKAKFANSFKWRLLECGVAKTLAEEVTQRLVLHLSADSVVSTPPDAKGAESSGRPRTANAKALFALGNRYIDAGAHEDAIDTYEELISIDPRNAAAFNNLGAVLCKVGRYQESERHFRQAIKLAPDVPDAYGNLGNLLFLEGRYVEAEDLLRRALKLNPRFVAARVNLGLTLVFLSRTREAKAQFEKVLKTEPRNADALFGSALVAKTDGRFDQAYALLGRALQANPKMPNALAAQAGMRKMTSSETEWIESAEALAAGKITPINEAELRFAMGKYYDDVGDFEKAFKNYKRGNELLRPSAVPYDRGARASFVDAQLAAYPSKIVSVDGHYSASEKPVLIVGMPRSGTSLTEQIIATHPSAKGAGEVGFWGAAVRDDPAVLESGHLEKSRRDTLAECYLQVLQGRAGDALRIVDKTPANSDYLGLIHSVFPKARIIYMTRDPIDTCLSCYFQQFVLSLNFTMDLSDLAHYYRQHHRLMAHWRTVLPAGTVLDVPYEGLVTDLSGWTRRILDFLGLDWDEGVLNFHETKRSVVTASFWQVRQRIYADSVRRWLNYEKFIGPLKGLSDIR